MKVLLVHSRYRSGAPSGENRVVDQELALLAAAGHEVERFQRDSDDIATWPLARKSTLPARSMWNGQVRSELARRLEQARPDVVHIHNTFPLISPSVLYACRDNGVPAVATIHNYKLLCASGDFFRDGKPCHDCAGGKVAPAVLHGCYRGSRLATVPVTAGMALHRPAWRSLVSAFIFISSSQREADASARSAGRSTLRQAQLRDDGAVSAAEAARAQRGVLGAAGSREGDPVPHDIVGRLSTGAP